ncbi:hypothetical protein VKT23_011077 [Stygiomarasmius scandens]|uniref:Uncharacterized protein n=1 Tax=Marasmiellus scandens TaxID=2682957 RepID=A0ABR1JAR7_9AGAR
MYAASSPNAIAAFITFILPPPNLRIGCPLDPDSDAGKTVCHAIQQLGWSSSEPMHMSVENNGKVLIKWPNAPEGSSLRNTLFDSLNYASPKAISLGKLKALLISKVELHTSKCKLVFPTPWIGSFNHMSNPYLTSAEPRLAVRPNRRQPTSRAWDLSAEEQDIAIGFIERLHAAYLGAQKDLLEEGKDAVHNSEHRNAIRADIKVKFSDSIQRYNEPRNRALAESHSFQDFIFQELESRVDVSWQTDPTCQKLLKDFQTRFPKSAIRCDTMSASSQTQPFSRNPSPSSAALPKKHNMESDMDIEPDADNKYNENVARGVVELRAVKQHNDHTTVFSAPNDKKRKRACDDEIDNHRRKSPPIAENFPNKNTCATETSPASLEKLLARGITIDDLRAFTFALERHFQYGLSECERLNCALADAKSRERSLVNELEFKTKQIAVADARSRVHFRMLEEEQTKSAQCLEDARAKLEDQGRQLNDADSKHQATLLQLRKAQSDLHDKTRLLETFQTTLDERSQSVVRAEAEIQSLRAQLSHAQDDYSRQEEQIQKQAKCLEASEIAKQGLQAQVLDVQLQMEESTQSSRKLSESFKVEKEELQSRLSTVEDSLREGSKSLEDVTGRLQAVEGRCRGLDESLDGKDNEILSLHVRLQVQADQAGRDKEDVTQKLGTAILEAQGLRAENDKIQEMLQRVNKELERRLGEYEKELEEKRQLEEDIRHRSHEMYIMLSNKSSRVHS